MLPVISLFYCYIQAVIQALPARRARHRGYAPTARPHVQEPLPAKPICLVMATAG